MLQVLPTRARLRVPKISRDAAEFLAINFLFIVLAVSFMEYGQVSPAISIANAILVALFVSYWVLHSLERKPIVAHRFALHELIALAFLLVFACSVFLFSASFGFNPKFLLYVPALFLFFVPFYLPSLLAVFLGVYALRSHVMGDRGRWLALSLFVLALLLLAFLTLSGYITKRPILDDEEFLALHAAKAAVNGLNPYSLSFAHGLYAAYLNRSMSLPTMTTSNNVVGAMDYPALYFSVFMPFAYSTAHGPYAFAYGGILVLLLLFCFAFFASLAWSLPVRTLRYPNYAIMAFAMLPLIVYSSVISIAMLAVLILAYSRLDKPYVWLILGVAASMQEMLWIPVLLMLAYVAMDSGSRRALAQAIGSLGVFIMINMPFIVQSPSSFLKSVLTPINGYLIPLPEAPIGYLILSRYPLLLPDMNNLFLLAILASVLAFAYLGKKRLLGIFSLLPLTFLYHAIPAYYAFFVSFAVLSSFIPVKKRAVAHPGSRALTARKWWRRSLLMALLLLAVLFASTTIYSHKVYANSSISASNVSASGAPNAITYTADLHYANATQRTVSVIAYAYYPSSGNIASFGTSCDTVLRTANSDLSASNVACDFENVNVNLFVLRGSEGNSHLDIAVNDSNSTSVPTAVGCALYGSGFFSMCPWVRTHRTG